MPPSAGELLSRIRSQSSMQKPQVKALPLDIRQRLKDHGGCPQCEDKAVALVVAVLPATAAQRRLEGPERGG